MKESELLHRAEKTLTSYPLCDSCLGRVFRLSNNHVSNAQRGKHIREQLDIKKKTKTKQCWLCKGLLDEITHFTRLISDDLKEYEFTTFLIGSRIDDEILNHEQELLRLTHSESTDTVKMEINREIGKILEKKLNKTVDFTHPDITAVIDTAYDVVHLQIKSLYIYGRYKKFERGIPQTKWPCRVCRGKGCRACEYTGKLYETSVEELIASKILTLTRGDDEAFHGCGREDIDARMLGTGRPFILEIKNPKKRIIDLNQGKREVNKFGKQRIEVSDLRFSDAEEVVRLKAAEFRKIYSVIIEGASPFTKEKLKKVAQVLHGATIQQFTPTRVAHRRAHTVRERKIYNCIVESVEGTIARLRMETASGTYVKELISGDEGKTTPNISNLIGFPCTVKELDVLEIKGE
ncbi:MAG: tRNA pseudouridine(54/55) synthase Pus10 [Methanobacteriota archaeon]